MAVRSNMAGIHQTIRDVVSPKWIGASSKKKKIQENEPEILERYSDINRKTGEEQEEEDISLSSLIGGCVQSMAIDGP